jgi:hypothetical protein
VRTAPLRIAAATAAGVIAGCLALAFAPTAAFAGTLGFGGGTAPVISSFSPVTLNGVPVFTSLTVAPFSVVDDTASGAGWHVTLTISDLTNGGSIIPASTLTMAQPDVTPSGGADPTNVAGHDSSGNFATGESIVTAQAGFGDGTYLVSPQPVVLIVPVSAVTGTYTCSATISVDSGP